MLVGLPFLLSFFCHCVIAAACLEMYQQQQQQPGAAMLYTASGQPVALTVESNVCQSYRSRQSVIAGAILICAGILSIIFNGISINLGEVFGFIGHGIWCGVLFIIAGAMGITAARKNRCLIIAFMVLAIIAASLALVMFILSVFGTIVGVPYHWRRSTYRVGTMCALMAVIALVAGSVAIWGSVIACKVTCCSPSTTGAVLSTGQPIVVYTAQPQQAYFSVPQVDPVMSSGLAGAPPAYSLPATYQPQQHPLPLQTADYSSPSYNPSFAAAAAQSYVYHSGDHTMPPTKM